MNNNKQTINKMASAKALTRATMVIFTVCCGLLLISCAPAATDQEINDMCVNLIKLRAEIEVPDVAKTMADIEERYKAKEKHLLDWKAREMKGWDDELAKKLEGIEPEDEEAKKALEDEYAKKKEIGSKQFLADIKDLTPGKAEAIKAAKEKITKATNSRDEKIKECLDKSKSEGISQPLAQCRIKAESTDKYWNVCK